MGGQPATVRRTVPQPGFVGRDPELARLRQAWQEVTDGEARVVGLEGDSGVGKTALVRRFLEEARPARVIWVSGDEEEAELPWGIVAQITREVPGTLTGPGGAGWDGASDPVFVGHALADDLRGHKNLVLVVDDAHWGDRLSMAAIRLAVRRLNGDHVMVLVVYQSPSLVGTLANLGSAPVLDDGWRRVFESDRGMHLELAGLAARDLVRLSIACGHPGLSPAGAARLYEHTGGHPLHVRHLLAEVPMHSIVFGQGALPAPRGVAMAVRSRLSSVSPETRQLVGAAAVLGRRFTLGTVRGLTGVSSVAAAVTEAIETGLLAETPGSTGQELSFTSGLVREVVYLDLEPAARRRLHRLVAARGGPGALWHRIVCADGPDEQLARDIEQQARRYLSHGRIPMAAAYLRHSVDLSPAGPSRLPRVLTAIEALLVAGDIATSLDYRGEVTAASGAWPDYVAGYQSMVSGQVADATARLQRALEAVRRDPPQPGQPADLEARIAAQLAVIALITVSYRDMLQYGTLAVAGAQEPWVAGIAEFSRSVGLAVAGRSDEALAHLSGVDAPGGRSGLDGLVARGMIRLWTDDLAGAAHDLNTALDRAMRGEALRVGQTFGYLSEVEYRQGLLSESVLHAELAVGDAEENDRVWDFAMLHGQACYPLAAQGEWERARQHAEQAAHWARLVGAPAGLIYAAAARASIAQARGDIGWMLQAADELETFYPSREPGTHIVGPVRADALSQLGRLDEAQDALDQFVEWAGILDRWSVQSVCKRVRGQIALLSGDPEAALRHCRTAEDLARRAGLRLEQSRVSLLAGRAHAAAGRRAAAERSLRSALAEFTAMGAGGYITQTLQAAQEAGLPVDAPPAALDALTPAERAVASLVCDGLSNREIAAKLVLSMKTVEFHLTNVFRRLDVSSRAELREAIARFG